MPAGGMMTAALIGGGLSAGGSIIGGMQASKAAKEALAQQKRFTEKSFAYIRHDTDGRTNY